MIDLYILALRYNAAYGKSTFQSSKLSNPQGDEFAGDKCVDGKLEAHWNNGSCCYTNRQSDINPWFSVDLGNIQKIYTVTIVNRADKVGKNIFI
jgi:hypothetical protein